MFGKGLTLFRLFGFTVRVDWSWLIIAALLTWSLANGVFRTYFPWLSPAAWWGMGAAGALGLFVSIVLHEFGHSLVARRFGIPMHGITLFVFGGVAEMGCEPHTPKAEFMMTIAGPSVTAVLAGLFFGLTQWGHAGNWPAPVMGVLFYLAWINVAVLAFNLLPAFPLDGGRVLRSVLWAWKKNLRWATRVASAIGIAFAFAMMGWGVFSFIFGNFISGVWFFLIGLFIRNASRAAYQQVLFGQALAGNPVRRFMTPNPVTVSPSVSVKSIVEDFLYKYPYKFYPVVDHGQVMGCVTIDRVKQVPKEEWEQRTAETVAEPCSQGNVVEPEADASEVLSTMSRNQVSRLMVVDHGQLLGMVTMTDLLNFLSRKLELEGA